MKFKTLIDLVRFAALSEAHFLHHTLLGGKEVYFIHILSPVEGSVYFAEQEEPVKGRYAVYDPYKDEVSFTEKLEVNPPRLVVPFLEVESDTVFSQYSKIDSS
jgi:hypothetical protein